MTTEEKRLTKLRELCDYYGITIKPNGPWRSCAEEDIAPYFLDATDDDFEPIGGEEAWAAVTESGDEHYIYPCNTYDAAVRNATENVGDSIYAEWPEAIYNLDTGDRYVPHATWTWSRLETPTTR